MPWVMERMSLLHDFTHSWTNWGTLLIHYIIGQINCPTSLTFNPEQQIQPVTPLELNKLIAYVNIFHDKINNWTPISCKFNLLLTNVAINNHHDHGNLFDPILGSERGHQNRHLNRYLVCCHPEINMAYRNWGGMDGMANLVWW